MDLAADSDSPDTGGSTPIYSSSECQAGTKVSVSKLWVRREFSQQP